MKIVIDLDEKYYNDIKNSPTASNYSTLYALFGIRNGTLLSEELEKIKAEMEKDKIILFYAPQKVEILNEWIEKLDKRIAELKGENNE